MLKEFVIILMTGVLINNYVLQQTIGICPFLGVSKKVDQAVGMGLAVTFVLVFATAATQPFYQYVLMPLKLEYLSTIAFILIIASLVQFVEIVLKKFIPALYKSLGVYLPLITTNCIVLAVTIANIETVGVSYGFLRAILYALGSGLGFLLAMVLFAGVRSKIENCPAPKCFKGVPITLVAASIVALAFLGFGGVVENLLA